MKPVTRSTTVRRVFLGACLTLPLGCCLLGCGGPNVERQHVSGAVTFRGKPIPTGQIIFNPKEAGGKGGARGGAQIINGQYNTNSEQGLAAPVGSVTVLVTGFKKDKDPEAGAGDPLFKTYKTTFEVTTETNTFDIAVP